jgi:oxaloacetate decarboxylase alpha subunit
MERIESLPRTRELRAEPPMAELSELRRRVDAASDEDFLLRATMPGGLVDAMRAAGAAPRVYDPDTAPLLGLLSRLLARRDLEDVTLEKAGFRLALRRNARVGA